MKDDKDTTHHTAHVSHTKEAKIGVLETGVLSSLVSLKPGQSVEVARDTIRDVIWDARIAAELPKGAVRGADGVVRDKDGKVVAVKEVKEVKDKDGNVLPAKDDVPPTREEIAEAIAAAHVPDGIIVTLLDSGNYQFYRPIGEDTIAVEDIAKLPKGTRVAIRT